MAFIRPYEKRDFEATAHICRATLPPSLASSSAAHTMAPYLWTHQYTHLSPSTCFVLDDGSGTAVGYCIGCPDTTSFAAAYPSYVSAVLDASSEVQQLRAEQADPLAPAAEAEPWTKEDGSVNGACLVQLAHDPLRLLAVEAAVAARFPATLHIDLLEGWQGKGWGGKLLERTVRALGDEQKKDAGGGVWIGVAADNAKVVPFYERMGFRLWEEEDDESHQQPHQQDEQDYDKDKDKPQGEKSETEPGAEGGNAKRGGSIVMVREFLGGAALRPGKLGDEE
ncbi:hypothetical protein B0T10DRAFT_480489 [Thelonectria olida]|uniref:N-acetyltransferase domain-containing protein n=1 Tax=Thelonectria olida TaxID=1576542 RepID=A0A9P9ASH1_9HYPO|nr:hypothetical protein B0T10DRAFT_480489 [Thelonectria olida]